MPLNVPALIADIQQALKNQGGSISDPAAKAAMEASQLELATDLADAINKFVNFVRGFSERTKIPLKVGFSDDDVNFTKSAKELFMSYEKTLNFPENFYVFDTSNPKLKGGVKVKI